MRKFYLYIFIGVFGLSGLNLLAQPANDLCSNATSLGTLPAPAPCNTFNPQPQTGAPSTLTGQTIVAATPSNPYPYQVACAPNPSSFPNDVWYTFTPTAPQVTIDITGATFANPTISLWYGACGNQIGIGCTSGSGGTVSMTYLGLEVGRVYYLQVAGADGTQSGTFNLSAYNTNDCANCLVTTALSVNPPPVNGVYNAGQTVTFCLTITAWNTSNSNWLHGVQPTFGSGWNLSTLTPGVPPPSIAAGGTWGFYPSGITSSAAAHSVWPAGFYYETSAGHGSLDANPGNNFGDYCDSRTIGSNCTWQFCFTITTNSVCTPGSDLSAVFGTSGDGESGVWSSIACVNDPSSTIIARGSCCPPTMSATTDVCSQGTGTATATPVGNAAPYTYQWSAGTPATQTGVFGASSVSGLSPGVVSVVITDVFNCSTTAQVNVVGGPGANAGPDRAVGCIALPGGSVTMAATGTGSWSSAANVGTATISNPSSPATTITNFSQVGTYYFIWNSAGCSDTARVTVGAAPNAGSDQALSCIALPGGSATMAAIGTGSWTSLTNPGTSTIVNPNSATTAIINFSAAGIYRYVWTTGGCLDTMQVTVTAAANAGPDRTVSCIILPGGTATMAAVGTGTWTPGSNPPGTATITTPSSATTTITGFSAAGVYTFRWTTPSGCVDSATVTVTAKPNAGPDQAVTCVTVPGGVATMAAVGTGTWTAGAGSGTATITTPGSNTTTITGFTAIGIYSFKWTNASGCIDTALVTVSAGANAGADKTVSCAVLPGGSTAMSATGSGTWSAGTNPGTATIVSPSSPVTVISGFSTPGIYRFIWTIAGGCTDTAIVTVTAKPDAGADQTVTCITLPGGTGTMAATGAGTWTAGTNPGTATITTPAANNTTITGFTAAGTYTFIFTNADGCRDSALVLVTAKPNAGVDKNVNCAVLPGGSIAMSATGTGTWSAGANPGTANIVSTTSATTVINTFSAAGVYIFKFTNAAGCIDTALVTVTARPSAGPNQTINCVALPGGVATMAAVGAGTWTSGSSNPGSSTITNPADPNTTITGFTVQGLYTFIWTNAAGCTSSATVTVTPMSDGGPDQAVTCATLTGGSVTMAAVTLTGTWSAGGANPGSASIVSPSSPTTIIRNFTAPGTYTFRWGNAGCLDTVLIVVTAQPNAGADKIVTCATLPGGTAMMSAAGTGTWSIGSNPPGSATITSPTSATTTITGFTAAGVYTFRWTTASGCYDSATITVTAKPDAGPDVAVTCVYVPGGTATMAATGTGAWTAGTNPGSAIITTPSSAATTITGFTALGVYTFRFTNAAGCIDTARVTVTAGANAGPDRTVTCAILPGGSATMAAAGTGTWSAGSNPGSATISTPSSGTTTIAGFTAPGTYIFIWTIAGGCIDTATVTVTAKPDAGADQSISCVVLPSGTATMAATGTGTWTALSAPGTSVITNPADPHSTITTFSAAGTYSYIWTNGTCRDTARITVTAQPDAGPAQTVSCAILPGGRATMAGSGTGTWSAHINPGTATITTPASPVTTITGFTAPGTYTFDFTNGTCISTTTVVVTAKPDAGPDLTVCRYTSATMAAIGTGSWTDVFGNPSPTTFANANSATTIISGFDQAGSYRFIWTSGGCTDTMTVISIDKPDAGSDQNICQGATATMAAMGTGTWSGLSTNAQGYVITNPSQRNTTITALTSIGVYSFIWSAAGCTDTVDIYVNSQPTVSIADTAVCPGFSATLTAEPSITGGSYLWSTTDPAQSITVSPPSTASYSVTYSLGICSAQATGTVTVYSSPAATVTTQNAICLTDNGRAKVLATGVSPFTYVWSTTTGDTTDTISGLAPDVYDVTVTDAHGCTAAASGTVGLDNPTIPIFLLSQHNLTCHGDNSGSITINAIDSGALIYTWTNTTGGSTVSGLSPQTYSVIVTDQFGCTGTGQYTITEPALLTLAPLAFTDPVCPGSSDGTATATPSGGSGAYHYVWSPSQQVTQQATGLVEGHYVVVVTDDSSCVATDSVDLIDPDATTFGAGSVTDARCHGGASGTATVNPQGLFGPYQYLWNDASHQVTAQATGLLAGQYRVVVTDARGCTVSTDVMINEPSALIVDVVHTDLNCYQNNSGTATATAGGGTLPYRYHWSTDDSTARITNLGAATYFVTAIDGLGCTVTGYASVIEPAGMILQRSSMVTTCASSVDGIIKVSATGGALPVIYSLQDITGHTIQSNASGVFTGLGPALFRVVATDQNGCNAGDTITVPRAAFNVYTATSDSTTCFGEQYRDGRIHLSGATIANGPFLFSVDGGPQQDIPDFYDLAAGPHDVRIVDAHGCDTSFIVIVGEPVPASVDILPGDTIVSVGSTVQLTTLFRPYNADSIRSYAWSPAEGLSCIDCSAPAVTPYATQNTYTVTVTYNQGCLAVTTVHVNTQGDPPFFLPNAFSPNGDGENDVLYLYGEGIKTMRLMVFNRWGEKVFESDNQSFGWDGMYRGVIQQPGVYTYVVDLIYLNDHKRVKEGSITLIR